MATGRVKKRAAVLISGRGSNMASLVEAAKAPSFPAEIALVISNRPDAAGLLRAGEAGVETEIIDHTTFGGRREAFEATVQAALEQHQIQIVCLAGFMRLLTPWFIGHWEGRLLNIHPALLPAFRGLNTHARALAAGVRIHGATVHFVTPEVDSGPIVVQAAVPVHQDDTTETLGARVLAVEHRIYPQALRLVAEGRAQIMGHRCTISESDCPDAALIVPAN